jgi:orotate phosphoribosyltransferase
VDAPTQREEILRLFEERGALLEGHFLLSSGKHSSRYVQCALVLQDPEATARLCAVLARAWQEQSVGAVVAPAVGGIVLSYELARALGARGLFMERNENDRFVLRRGFAIHPGESVVVAEDVVTTGGSVAGIIEEVRAMGGNVAGVAALVDRSGGVDLGCPLVSCLEIEIPVFEPDECPLCRSGGAAVKPGSRKKPC